MKLDHVDTSKEQLKDTVGNADASYFKLDDDFQEYGPRPQHVLKWMVRKYCAPFRSANAFGRALFDFFPIFKWLPAYSWRENLLFDFISGVTTGVMFVPQGIAYSYLAGVAPVYGLYSSFFAPLFYIFLGCSPHVSRGPSSVLGIMSGVSNEQIRQSFADNLALMNSSLSSEVDELAGHLPDPITVAATLTFTIGLIQLGMGLAHLEFAADYFSEALVGGYTLAAAVHVLISQAGVLLGVSLRKGSTPGYLFKMAYELITRIFETNPMSAMASAFGIAFLVVGKDVVNPWFNRKSRIKILLPYELMLMIIATLVSQYFNWSTNYRINVVGDVPKGLPMPIAPRFDLILYALPNAAAIALVTLAMHFSMVKLFASRMHYVVESGQELYAIGLGSILSGCFPVYPTSTALGRTLVMVESGAKSQLSTAVSCVLVLTVILWFGPLFRPLPQCILSVVVVVALRPIFNKAPEICRIWRLSKYDGTIWLVTFIGTVLTNVITGLCIGIVFALFTAIFRTQWPVWGVKFSRCSFYANPARIGAKSFVEYCVFRFDSFLLFTNAHRFEKYVGETLRRWKRTSANADLSQSSLFVVVENGNNMPSNGNWRLFVFDFSTITQIDVAGLMALHKSATRILCENHAQRIAFISCHECIRVSLLNAEIVSNISDDFFTSLDDALRAFRKFVRISLGTSLPPLATQELALDEQQNLRSNILQHQLETLAVRKSELPVDDGENTKSKSSASSCEACDTSIGIDERT